MHVVMPSCLFAIVRGNSAADHKRLFWFLLLLLLLVQAHCIEAEIHLVICCCVLLLFEGYTSVDSLGADIYLPCSRYCFATLHSD